MTAGNRSDPSRVTTGAFVLCFFSAGIPFWMIPYAQAKVPNGFYGFGLVVIFVVAALLYFTSVASFKKSVLIPGLALPAALMARVIVEGIMDPTRHNLWPLALMIVLVLGVVVAAAGALVGYMFAGLKPAR